MGLEKLDLALSKEVDQLIESGRAKPAERIINGYVAPSGSKGPRYKVEDHDLELSLIHI